MEITTKDTKTDNSITINGEIIKINQTVYFSYTIEDWDKPYARKQHHASETKSVILKGKVVSIEKNHFKAFLFGNNNFEKDGEEYVFHKGCLLSNQAFKELKELGVWKKNPSLNP